ncbi:MAG TPA: hypothetical protein VHV51_17350 [Polyangiaceae bacterium]|jgi:hypothetical protein|nr:hypothetical protein [Polyangiaceae bacterium]
MFEIQPSDEFSAWFESLSPEAAEEVACALDVLGAAGATLGPSQVSRALLWFDGTGSGMAGSALLRFGLPSAEAHDFERVRARILRGYSELGAELELLIAWQREVVRCFESEAFRARLARLAAKRASEVLEAIERLKQHLHAARVERGFELQSAALRRKWRELSSAELGSLAERFGHGDGASETSRELRAEFFGVLRLVGLEPSQVMNATSGLCELTIAGVEPHLHVLFGLDAHAKRIVVFLGEPLTRSYYGDSVKFAEQRWREYCARASAELETR